jgi:hypothetical protein
MHVISKKALELFASWTFRQFEHDNPGADATPEESAEFGAKVHEAFTTEFRKTQLPAQVERTNTDGSKLRVRIKAGLEELLRYRTHPAFARVEACANCTKSAQVRGARVPKWCRCPSDMQRFIDKALTTFATKEDRRMLMYLLLILRESVEHYNFYGNGKPRPKELVADRREREPMRDKITAVREEWRDDNNLRYREVTEIQPTDSTSRLYDDLRVWDRPNAPSQKTQRLAFCGMCGDLGNNPWFWVARKRVDGRYERGPFALTAHCPVCKSLEVKPDLPPRTNIQSVGRKVRRHGKELVEYTLFYRSGGHWVNARTHEVCSTDLSNRLQQRWRKIKPLKF